MIGERGGKRGGKRDRYILCEGCAFHATKVAFEECYADRCPSTKIDAYTEHFTEICGDALNAVWVAVG